MNIDLSKLIIKKFHNVLNDILEHKYTNYWLKGGRGTTKSSFIGFICVILLMYCPDINILVLRKVGATLKDSVYNQIVWAIEKLGLSDQFIFLTSPLLIIYKPTGQKIYFRGADKPLKIKSLKPDIGYIGVTFFEEVDQFNSMEEIRNILQSTNRGGSKFWNFYAFNPPKNRNHWVNTSVLEYRKDKIVIHTTYLDVPKSWLGEQFFIEAEELKRTNKIAYEHEYLGLVVGNGGAIFNNIENKIITKEEIENMDYFYYGCDFGYSLDPFAWVKVSYDKKRKIIYILDEIYSTNLLNSQAINLIKKKMDNDNSFIVADSSEPKTIAEYNLKGLKTYGAKKGKDSVNFGISWLQERTKIIIDPIKAPNTLREFMGYEYDKDKFDNFIHNYPDKNNHTIDAVRYALEKHINNKKIRWG